MQCALHTSALLTSALHTSALHTSALHTSALHTSAQQELLINNAMSGSSTTEGLLSNGAHKCQLQHAEKIK